MTSGMAPAMAPTIRKACCQGPSNRCCAPRRPMASAPKPAQSYFQPILQPLQRSGVFPQKTVNPLDDYFVWFKREPVAHQRDLYRDSPLRLLSFVNDIGEAFKFLLVKGFGKKWGHWLYLGSYGVTGGYVGLDALDKGMKAYKRSARNTKQETAFSVGTETVGAGVFQFFASYLIPVKIVEWLRKKSQNFVVKNVSKNHTVRLALPAIFSALSIPILVKPIDHMVETIMKHTYWKGVEWVRKRNFKDAAPHPHS